MPEPAPRAAGAGTGPSRKRPAPARVIVIGVGNALRGDDAAGLEVVRRVSARAAAAAIAVREQEGEALGLLEQWEGAGAAVLVDAIHSGAPAGTVRRVDASCQAIPARLGSSSSTHAIGVAEVVELARAMGRLPGRVILYGVEGASFETGEGLSAEVQAAIAEIADAVFDEACELAR